VVACDLFHKLKQTRFSQRESETKKDELSTPCLVRLKWHMSDMSWELFQLQNSSVVMRDWNFTRDTIREQWQRWSSFFWFNVTENERTGAESSSEVRAKRIANRKKPSLKTVRFLFVHGNEKESQGLVDNIKSLKTAPRQSRGWSLKG